MRLARRIVLVVVLALLAVGAGAWIVRGGLSGLPVGRDGVSPAPGEVSADRARYSEERIRRFTAGEGPDTLLLGAADLRSLLRYRTDGAIPRGVEDPDVVLTDSVAVLSGTLVPAELPEERGGGGALQGLLGDSTVLRARVVPALVRTGVAEVRVRGLEAGSLTLPSMLVPTILRRSGLAMEKGRPRSVLFPVSDRLADIVVRDSLLVLRRSESYQRDGRGGVR